MSRIAQRSGVPPAKPKAEVEDDGESISSTLSNLQLHRTPAKTAVTDDVMDIEAQDICPVCKSKRYLNRNMRFLVNPECYHKMCESCVDRIFSHGPAKCPIAGCPRTLRKNKFRKQTFEDIKIEREVDIRRDIARTFNRREEDFETLKDYNDYLNKVEDITFNLIEGIDVEQTRKELDQYKDANRQSIAANDSLARQEVRSRAEQEVAAKEQARMRREALRKEAEDERREIEEGKLAVLNAMASGQGDAARIAAEHRVALKRSQTRKLASERQADAATNGAAGIGFRIKGLKTKVEEKPEGPYDPYEGLSVGHDYSIIQNDYDWEWLGPVKKDVKYQAGGYDMKEYYSRALCDAFAGFGILVEEEVARRDAAGDMDKASATQAAAGTAAGGPEVSMNDVF